MNYMIFLTLLNLILISRLRLLFKDGGANRKDALIMAVFPCLVLPFLQISLGWFLLLIWLAVYPWLFLLFESRAVKLNRSRMLLLMLHVVVLVILVSPLFNLQLNSLADGIEHFIIDVLLLNRVEELNFMSIQLVLFGFLLVINETNILLRYLLNVFRLKPISEKGAETDQKEYNTGRLIGILERIFVFIFVLLGQYAAIGFILAAKGVARFQDFKSRTFAEYVLIGTLLSTLLAMAVGYFVKAVLVI
ncbi:hypothetical protein G3570_06020 [Balneolaceae bacterium YR4-1]|uniref:DUF3307 domain-containing protein n=1 Tax=Halalkalibaculum roseum TaxID=2709311 RepID=A0A6M1SMD6_9BACT|nr:hypothetical protein [Halalkalibaculum roseum]NGP76179.1 hypothetical protein [Halalkalibaculum roseum]